MSTKHTPGPWRVSFSTVRPVGRPDIICDCMNEDAQANAALIAEAGTVATETGLSPREMQQQWRDLRRVLDRRTNERDEMMAALLDVVNIKPATSGADAVALCEELELLQARFREIIAPWHPTI